jgi:hypothetical protein
MLGREMKDTIIIDNSAVRRRRRPQPWSPWSPWHRAAQCQPRGPTDAPAFAPAHST